VAGIALWEDKPSDIGAKTSADRTQDCRRFLAEYTDWCNGSCYWYSIESEDGTIVDSCGGFIGDSIIDAIRDAMPDDATADNTTIVGDCRWLAEYHDVFNRKAATV
jgi:hypothetical protein